MGNDGHGVGQFFVFQASDAEKAEVDAMLTGDDKAVFRSLLLGQMSLDKKVSAMRRTCEDRGRHCPANPVDPYTGVTSRRSYQDDRRTWMVWLGSAVVYVWGKTAVPAVAATISVLITLAITGRLE